jgi:multidrug efflux system membrane fusion protein
MSPKIPRRSTRGPCTRGIGGAVLTLFLLTGCNDKNTYVPPPLPKVRVAEPLRQTATLYLDLTGNTQAVNTVTLNARVQGFLTSIDYTDGARVHRGERLFTIEKDAYVAALDQAKANLASQQAALVQAQQEFIRKSTLGKQDFASGASVEDAKAKLDQANAGVDGAKASIQTAQINLGYTEITAPFDGTMTNHLVDVGALVGFGGPTALATILATNPIYVVFNVAEPQVLKIKAELARQGRQKLVPETIPVEVGLQSESGYPHVGRLDYIAPQVDPATGTLTVRGALDNPTGTLLPGLFVRVRVPITHIEDALMVAETAIGTGQTGTYVLVVGADDVVEQRPVTLGQDQDGGLRLVTAGLDARDSVIVGGLQVAVPGNKVVATKVSMLPNEASVPLARP